MFRNILKFVVRKNNPKYIQIARTTSNFHGSNDYQENHGDYRFTSIKGPLVCASFFSVLNIFKRDNPEEESELVMLIKRSILCMQKEEYAKAEQMLHIALKVAQELQDKEGITYIFDTMANLAYEVGNYEKAEKLFVSVMQRLLGDGVKEDDIRIIHMSAKLAQMAALQDKMDKGLQGFEWSLKKIEQNVNFQENSEMYELWGLIKNWYAQALMQVGRYKEAKVAFLDAYNVFKKFRDDISDEGIQLLNNLGVACTELNELDLAEEFLKKAVDIAVQVPDLTDVGIYHANLGLVYFKRGLLERAKQLCSFAYRTGKKNDNEDSITQATYCLDQIKKSMLENENN